MDLIDIGINLTHDSYDEDRDAVLRRARAVGVRQMIVTGATLAGSTRALALARAHPRILFATAGVHPHHAHELRDEDLPALRELLRQPGVVAAGECGLDYFRNYSPYAAQRQAFERQLILAAECGQPLFLHQRDAHRDFIALLHNAAQHAGGRLRGVAHCFTGGADELDSYLALGLHIGITGWICDERRGQHLHELVRRIPPERLLLETDGPYLLPRDLHPKPASRRNEPQHLAHIAAAVAHWRNESVEELAAHSSAAARALFALAA